MLFVFSSSIERYASHVSFRNSEGRTAKQFSSRLYKLQHSTELKQVYRLYYHAYFQFSSWKYDAVCKHWIV